jgi:hypothetical protein
LSEKSTHPLVGHELKIPRSFREHLGRICLVSGIVTVVAVVSALSVASLIRFDRMPVVTIVCASVWLGLVICHLVAGVREEKGTRQFLVNRLGSFSRDQFVDVSERDGSELVLGFGFRLFGRRFYYGGIPFMNITSVEWNPGQATDLAGEDMHDWTVAVWYVPEPPAQPRFAGRPRPDEDLRILGSSGPRSSTESFGLALVDLLAQAGLSVREHSDCKYVTPRVPDHGA